MSLTVSTEAASTVPAAVASPPSEARRRASVRKQVRGSSLLLLGRGLAKGLNFAVQVLTVRYLSKNDYGAFAYALSLVAFLQALSTFGLDRAITRFLPIFQERGEHGKFFGTVVMVVASVVGLGLSIAVGFNVLCPYIPPSWIADPQALGLLTLLVFLAPLQALDELLVGLFAVLASPKAIFFRKHLLTPLLKLSVVALLIAGQGNVRLLAWGYLAASLFGTSVCGVLLWRMVRRHKLLEPLATARLEFPWREVLTFTVPLLSSELVYVVMHTVDAVLLAQYGSVRDVATFKAVVPTSLLNQLVMASFATLFTPLAARMFARQDHRGINDLYWQTAAWIAVLSFPIFALTFSLAEPFTLLVFGAEYRESALVLALLSLGHYVNAAFGFNGLTLKVCGRLRYVVTINLVTAAAHLALALALIPVLGAVGAATGSCTALVLHNFLKQAGLRQGTGVQLLDRRYWRPYVVIGAGAAGLGLVQVLLAPPLPVSLVLAGLASLAVLRLNRELLQAGEMFPELQKVRLLWKLLGTESTKNA
jgi:O-antigen/teichoic acid export membrane protein